MIKLAAGIRLTTDEAKEMVNNAGYKMLSDTYINAKTHINVEDSLGYRYSGAVHNLVSKNPQIVVMTNKYSIYNIKHFIKLHKANVDLITNEYINNNTKMVFRCRCGDTYECSWGKFRSRKQFLCNKCSFAQRGLNRKFSIEYVKGEFLARSYTPMFDNYVNSDTNLLCKDIDGYKGFISLSNLKNGCTFDAFSVNNLHTIENIQRYIKINNLGCKILSDRWTSNKSPMDFKCECGNHFEAMWCTFTLQNKTRCSECSGSKSSYAKAVEDWLINNDLNFDVEHKFDDCVHKGYLFFDYKVNLERDKFILIEVDGEHHYEPIMCWGGLDGLSEQITKDNIKTKYCEDNKIKLLRIPYWEISNGNYKISLEDLFN